MECGECWATSGREEGSKKKEGHREEERGTFLEVWAHLGTRHQDLDDDLLFEMTTVAMKQECTKKKEHGGTVCHYIFSFLHCDSPRRSSIIIEFFGFFQEGFTSLNAWQGIEQRKGKKKRVTVENIEVGDGKTLVLRS